MSAFREAARQVIESELVCPRCQEENIPGKPFRIRLEDPLASEHAGCDTCGFDGRLKDFQRRKRGEK